MSRAGLDKEPRDVARMFDTVAQRYDVTNDVLSLGQDRRWRRKVVDLVAPKPGERILDLAAGTGTSSEPFREAGATVVPCDFSLGMLQEGRRRFAHLPFVAGDGMRLPQGLRELRRVTRPGGRIVVCEFSTPTWEPFAAVYSNYLMRALPSIARRTSSNPESYVYLAESIRAWPDQKGLALRMVEAGWGRVEWHNLSGGIVALHHSFRP